MAGHMVSHELNPIHSLPNGDYCCVRHCLNTFSFHSFWLSHGRYNKCIQNSAQKSERKRLFGRQEHR